MTRKAIAHRQDREKGHEQPDGAVARELRQRAMRRRLARMAAGVRGRGYSRAEIDRALDLYDPYE